jgi:hypothetical protein
MMAPRKKTLEELRREAIAELERRGYNVRGKTPAQIRQMLRARPTRRAALLEHENASSQDNYKEPRSGSKQDR